jgi:exopolyphosphatase/guanosine-5'-triphosphate,3'-diphosphate pyrophosphatase
MSGALANPMLRLQLLALRLAVLFHHARQPVELPRFRFAQGDGLRLEVPAAWLKAHPLTTHLLDKERAEWRSQGHPWR